MRRAQSLSQPSSLFVSRSCQVVQQTSFRSDANRKGMPDVMRTEAGCLLPQPHGGGAARPANVTKWLGNKVRQAQLVEPIQFKARQLRTR